MGALVGLGVGLGLLLIWSAFFAAAHAKGTADRGGWSPAASGEAGLRVSVARLALLAWGCAAAAFVVQVVSRTSRWRWRSR